MEIVGNLPGIPGLFIAGVFGAAMSSLSVVLNSTALVVLEDIAKGCFRLKISERASGLLVKGCIVTLGGMAVALVLVLEQLSGILSVATSVTAIAAGTTCGLFTLGMLVPWSNTKGAVAGAVAGAFMSGWIAFGTQWASAQGLVVPEKLNLSTEMCTVNISAALNILDDMISTDLPTGVSDVFPLYRLSFHWINPIGVCTTVIVGTIASFLTGATVVKKIDAELISPVLHRCVERTHLPLSLSLSLTLCCNLSIFVAL